MNEIQTTQNRESEATQVKLDELICAIKEAQNSALDAEDLTEHELHKLKDYYVRLAAKARKYSASDDEYGHSDS